MRLDLACRLSSYLTLGLAVLALGYTEQAFLSGAGVFVLVVLGLIATAFILEGRWTLSVQAANVVVVVVVVVMGLWTFAQLAAPVPVPGRRLGPLGWLLVQLSQVGEPLLKDLPFPAAQLPYVGPLLMVLLVLQLFRPPSPTSFWILQGIGLLLVILGCVLATDELFGALLIAYLVSAVWCLTLWHLYHEHTACQAHGPLPAGPRPLPFLIHLPRSLVRAGGWTLAVGGLALAVFLLTPRLAQTQWHALSLSSRASEGRLQTGYAESIDLRRTGRVEVTNEVAFTVFAEDAEGQPKLDLGPEQRWRGLVLDQYDSEQARWTNGVQNLRSHLLDLLAGELGRPGVVPRPGAEGRRLELPDLGPTQFYLNYRVAPRRAGGLFLAEPIVLEANRLPVTPTTGDVPRGMSLFEPYFGTLLPTPLIRGEIGYRQVCRPADSPDLGPPVRMAQGYLDFLVDQRVRGLRPWADELVQRLAAEGRYGLTPADMRRGPAPAAEARRLSDLPAAGARRASDLPPPQWEKVARALSTHLATSGEYTYTLDLRRHDLSLDPTLDFLSNVKQGHCERYASALALLLRVQGIPARVVKGFRGADSREDGFYDVRHSHAHSWVEVLVVRRGPLGQPEQRWLTLDPTPSASAQAGPALSWDSLWSRLRSFGPNFWRTFVVEYNADHQASLAEDMAGVVMALNPWRSAGATGGAPAVGPGLGWLGLLGVAGAALLVWRRRWRARRQRAAAAAAACPVAVAFYARLLGILERGCGLRPDTAQTPREFGRAAKDVLGHGPTAALADLPGTVAALFYRVRFGRLALGADEQHALERRLDELEMVLRGARVETRPAST